jgi:hypothetical protein
MTGGTKDSRVEWPRTPATARTQGSFGRFAVPLWDSNGFGAALGGRKKQDFLVLLSHMNRIMLLQWRKARRRKRYGGINGGGSNFNVFGGP